MEDVKRRIGCLRRIASGELSLGDERLYWELSALQLRMVLELIAFASLSAHRDAYSRVHAKFATHWKAALLVKELAAIHSQLIHMHNPFGDLTPISIRLTLAEWVGRIQALLDTHFIRMHGINQLWVVQMAGGPSNSAQVAVAEPRSAA